jgi:hypothetical protein
MSSNDVVSWHPKAFAGVIGQSVDVNAPHVYYGGSPSVASRLAWAQRENAFLSAPFFPVGVSVVEPSGEREGGFPDAATCAARGKDFIDLCSDLHRADPATYPGYGFFDWDQAPEEFWAMLENAEVFTPGPVALGVRANALAEPADAAPDAASVASALDAPAFDPIAAANYGQFVVAAYSMFNVNRSDLRPEPTGDFPSGYELAAWVQMNDFVVFETGPTFYGFIAQNKADPTQFVMALRGVQTPEEWWDSLVSIARAPFSIGGFGSVAAGFDRIYQTLEVVARPDVGIAASSSAPRSLRNVGGFSQQVAALAETRLAASGLRAEAAPTQGAMTVVGHSLGAALATLYTVEGAQSGKLRHPLLCTFASPRVGDHAFATAFAQLPLTAWRIVNTRDVVPMLPPEISGFAHVGQTVAYDSARTTKFDIPCWHAMATYLSLIDKSRLPDIGCRVTAVDRREPSAGLSLPVVASASAADAGTGGVDALMHIASDPKSLQAAQREAARRLLEYDGEQYPSDGCAITLSVLLQSAGFGVPDTFQAIALAQLLEKRGWRRIVIGDQRPGDIGSTCGTAPRHGVDHIYLVLKAINRDEMIVADNQDPAPHFRLASGGEKSPTKVFLRPPDHGASPSSGASQPRPPARSVSSSTGSDFTAPTARG